MEVTRITIETVRFKGLKEQSNVVVFWTADGQPHTLPDVDHNIAYATRLADKEDFEIVVEPERRRVQPLPSSPHVGPDGEFFPMG